LGRPASDAGSVIDERTTGRKTRQCPGTRTAEIVTCFFAAPADDDAGSRAGRREDRSLDSKEPNDKPPLR
jgi:hypothetical protein